MTVLTTLALTTSLILTPAPAARSSHAALTPQATLDRIVDKNADELRRREIDAALRQGLEAFQTRLSEQLRATRPAATQVAEHGLTQQTRVADDQ